MRTRVSGARVLLFVVTSTVQSPMAGRWGVTRPGPGPGSLPSTLCHTAAHTPLGPLAPPSIDGCGKFSFNN